MALGIDIYERYQDVTDWGAVARHGVGFCWIKASDGGRHFRGDPARRPDALVGGAKSVGIPVGLYHYAQPNPLPEAQADILTAEVRRLDAVGIPPALDLEAPFTPNAAAREFARRFLQRLRDNGFPSVALYANTSMLTGISADTIPVSEVRIWAANYGPNNGRRNPMNYRGRVDVHQYTSVGTVPGIAGRVDLNESLTDITEDDMPLSDDDIGRVANAVWDTFRPHLNAESGNPALPMWVWAVGANMGAWEAAEKSAPAVDQAKLGDLLAPSLLSAITRFSDEQFAELVKKVNEEADRRNRERANAPVQPPPEVNPL